jgi:hypothetical protein
VSQLSKFNLFIGETGAIQQFPGKDTFKTFHLHPSVFAEKEFAEISDHLSAKSLEKVEKILRLFDLEEGDTERLLRFYLFMVASDRSPTKLGFTEFGNIFDPRFARRLTEEIVLLANNCDFRKQICLFTQNVGCLDGVDVADDDQRLFVVSYNRDRVARVRRISPPKVIEGQEPVQLSEAYLRGYLGGLAHRSF